MLTATHMFNISITFHLESTSPKPRVDYTIGSKHRLGAIQKKHIIKFSFGEFSRVFLSENLEKYIEALLHISFLIVKHQFNFDPQLREVIP